MRSVTKPRLRTLIGLWIVILAVWATSGFVLYSSEQRGTFGDMFGAVNALFTGLAFATLIYTAWMQREELALQREELAATRAELEGQKLQLQDQTRTFAMQRFEDSFFALLGAHGDIVNAMDLVGHENRITKGRDCFNVSYSRLKKHHSRTAVYQDGNALATVQKVYEEFYDQHQAELGHYFRHLYHIIKFVKQSSVENKKQYTSLVRAQLSAFEHLMLFYNCLSSRGIEKFKPLVEEFALLENMPKRLLIAPGLHAPLYAASAYGDELAA